MRFPDPQPMAHVVVQTKPQVTQVQPMHRQQFTYRALGSGEGLFLHMRGDDGAERMGLAVALGGRVPVEGGHGRRGGTSGGPVAVGRGGTSGGSVAVGRGAWLSSLGHRSRVCVCVWFVDG